MNRRIWIFPLALLAASSAAYMMDGSDTIYIIVCIASFAAFQLSPREAGALTFGISFFASSLLFAFGFEAYAFNLAVVSLAILVSALVASLVRYRDSGRGNGFIGNRREGFDVPAESRKEKSGRDRIRRLHVEDPRIPEK